MAFAGRTKNESQPAGYIKLTETCKIGSTPSTFRHRTVDRGSCRINGIRSASKRIEIPPHGLESPFRWRRRMRENDPYQLSVCGCCGQSRNDLGYTGRPRSHLLIAAADATAATVKGSTASRGNQ